MIGPPPDDAPTIVMLHEGLGSAELWGDFPEKLQAATGAGIFAYSRAGYGASTPVKLPRPIDYMHTEALDVLPKLLERSASAAGSCSAIPTAPRSLRSMPAAIRIIACEGVAMIAPHFIVEDISVASIAKIKTAYETTELKASSRAGTRMSTTPFMAGTAPGSIRPSATGIFPNTSLISASPSRSSRVWRQYGTMRQIEIAREECYCPVDVTVIPGAGHAPHREAPGAALDAIQEFANAVLRVDGSQGRAA